MKLHQRSNDPIRAHTWCPMRAERDRRAANRLGAIGALAVAHLLGACAYAGGFLQAQSPRTLFERGYFAEMAIDGRAPMRMADGLRVDTDLRYRRGTPARDDRAHLLDVYAPAAGAGPWPLVVYAHGGGLNAGAKDDETQVNRNFAIALAGRGFVVMSINHRLVDEAPHPAQAQDMAAAVRWGIDNAARWNADASRIVLAGFSSGGYLAALLAGDTAYLRAEQVDPVRIGAVLAVSGFFDLGHLAEAFLVRRFIVEPAFGPRGPGWIAASPVNHAGAHWPATLLVTAAQDRSAIPESDELCARLGRHGIRCDRLTVPSSRHATAIARLGDGRAQPELETLVAFLAEATGASGASTASPFVSDPDNYSSRWRRPARDGTTIVR